MAVAMYRLNTNETSAREKGERSAKQAQRRIQNKRMKEEKKQIWNRVCTTAILYTPYNIYCMYI